MACDDGAVAPVAAPTPQSIVHYSFARDVTQVGFIFTVTADGRALDIKRTRVG